MVPTVILICIFLITDVEHFFMYLFTVHMPTSVYTYFRIGVKCVVYMCGLGLFCLVLGNEEFGSL